MSAVLLVLTRVCTCLSLLLCSPLTLTASALPHVVTSRVSSYLRQPVAMAKQLSRCPIPLVLPAPFLSISSFTPLTRPVHRSSCIYLTNLRSEYPFPIPSKFSQAATSTSPTPYPPSPIQTPDRKSMGSPRIFARCPYLEIGRHCSTDPQLSSHSLSPLRPPTLPALQTL